MKSTVLEDEGAFTQVQFRYFSVHNVFHLSPRRQKKKKKKKKKCNVSQVPKFLRKGPIYSLLGGGWGAGGAEFWSIFPLFFPLSHKDHWMDM